MLKYIADLLSQNSTWKGIFAVLTATGIVLKPDQQIAITATGFAIIGLINVFISEDAPKVK